MIGLPSMISIDTEQRPDILRHVALLLDRENRHLHERIKTLTLRNAQLEGKDAAALQLKTEQLQELLARREQTIFGASSEKRSRSASKPELEPAPRTGHGPTEQPQLPVIKETLKLAPCELICPTCEGTLEEIGGQADESEEITVVERRFFLVKRRRQKYSCRCNGAVVTTPAPPKFIPGGRYSPEFAVEVAVGKYLDDSPLERQSGRWLGKASWSPRKPSGMRSGLWPGCWSPATRPCTAACFRPPSCTPTKPIGG